MHFEVSTLIDAPVDLIWRLTSDIAAWPSFVPTVTRLDVLDSGPLGPGSRARLKQPGMAPLVWTVTRFDPLREFSWETKLLGVRMTGGHLLSKSGVGTHNRLTLDITGAGAGLMSALFGRAMCNAVTRESAAFAAQAAAVRDHA